LKACLVAQGYTQTYDIDYDEEFSLVVEISFAKYPYLFGYQSRLTHVLIGYKNKFFLHVGDT
jgi:hypothetical protein